MSLYVVVGAGPLGRETARLAAEEGHDVILTSRNRRLHCGRRHEGEPSASPLPARRGA